jgi:hypothetical protein
MRCALEQQTHSMISTGIYANTKAVITAANKQTVKIKSRFMCNELSMWLIV